MPGTLTRTTLTLPAELLARVDQAARQGRARSRNAFVATALERDLAAQERAALDAEFAGMGEDEAYLAESQILDAEFDAAGGEALRLAEGRTRGVATCMTRGSIPQKGQNRPAGAQS